MKKAGVKMLLFGVESGNQDVLNFYNKQVTIPEIENTIKLAHEMDFLVYASFIFGAPMETKEHIENTINFACSLPIDVADFSPLFYIRGSELWKKAVEEQIISIDESIFLADKNKGLCNFTSTELQEFREEAFNRFFKRPGFLLNQLYRTLNRGDFNLLFNGMKYVFLGNSMSWNSKDII